MLTITPDTYGKEYPFLKFSLQYLLDAFYVTGGKWQYDGSASHLSSVHDNLMNKHVVFKSFSFDEKL